MIGQQPWIIFNSQNYWKLLFSCKLSSIAKHSEIKVILAHQFRLPGRCTPVSTIMQASPNLRRRIQVPKAQVWKAPLTFESENPTLKCSHILVTSREVVEDLLSQPHPFAIWVWKLQQLYSALVRMHCLLFATFLMKWKPNMSMCVWKTNYQDTYSDTMGIHGFLRAHLFGLIGVVPGSLTEFHKIADQAQCQGIILQVNGS